MCTHYLDHAALFHTTASFSTGWAMLTLGWLRDASTTKGKRSIMFNQSLRVRNAGLGGRAQFLRQAGALPLFEAASWSHSIAPFTSTQAAMLKSQTKLTWRVTQSLLSQTCWLSKTPKETESMRLKQPSTKKFISQRDFLCRVAPLKNLYFCASIERERD